jgi:anti-anti-sigma factor
MHIGHRRRDDITVVTFEGEFDFHDVTSASETIGAVLDGGARQVLFDLKGLRFISSGGIGYFIQTAKQLRRAGGELVLASAPDAFTWVAQTLGIDRVIRIFVGEEEAITYLRSPGDGGAELSRGPAQAST